MEEIRKTRRRDIVKRFLIWFLPLAVGTGLVAFLIYRIDERSQLNLTLVQESNSIEARIKSIEDELYVMASDLLYLASMREVKEMPESPGASWKRTVATEFSQFSSAMGFYDQVRLIGETGREVVRVDSRWGAPRMVPESLLQEKGERYYFKEAFGLGKDEIYLSPFDLNVEEGSVEVPFKPVIRAATPVFDGRGRKRGVLVLNYLGARLIERFDNSVIGSAGDALLLNSAGYYLRGRTPSDEWGFMLSGGRDRTFAREYPEEWKMISAGDKGQFLNENGLFTFATVYPAIAANGENGASGKKGARKPPPDARSYQWKAVSHIPYNMLRGLSSVYLERITQLYAFLVILLAMISGYMAVLGAKKKEAEEEASEKTALLEESNRELKELNEKLKWEIGVRKSAEESALKMGRLMDERALQLESANRELEAFSYVASHDLQEPLRIIAGYVQLLEKRYKDKLDKDADEFIGYAVEGTKRMQRLITDLLNYSRLGPRGMELKSVDLSDILRQTVNNMRVSIEESGAVITGGALPVVTADPTQMLHLFMNLVGNAIKYRGEEPLRINVSSEERPGEWVVTVQDNGIGIDPRYRERIFQLFQRLHGKDQYAGTGIGLSICKKVVENLGGRIWVESEPGKGSAFHFTIPKRSD